MRITTTENVDVEVELEIGVDQITAALQGSLCDLQEEPRGFVVQTFFNDVYACLRAIDDSMLEHLPPRIRELVGQALREQADRYAPEVPQ